MAGAVQDGNVLEIDPMVGCVEKQNTEWIKTTSRLGA
jgi:hypothetical protein